MVDAPTASEQLELRQHAELLRTDVIREEVNVLLESIQASAYSGRNNRYCATLIANALIDVISAQTMPEAAGRDKKGNAKQKAAPEKVAAAASFVNLSILRSYPFLMPAGFDLTTVSPALSSMRIPLRPTDTPTIVSPWLHEIYANVPGSTSLYIDIVVPIMPLDMDVFEDSAHFLVKAAYLAGLLHHVLLPTLKLLSPQPPSKAVTSYAKGDAVASSIYDKRVVNIGVSYLENSMLQPVLSLYIDASDYFRDLVDVQMPVSRNMLFRFVPQIACNVTTSTSLNSLFSRRFAAPFIYGDPRRDVVAPPFALISQTALCTNYDEIVNSACLALTTPTLQQVAVLFYLFLVLHGAAPRVHLNPQTVQALDAQRDTLLTNDADESSESAASASYGFSGCYPSHGLSFLAACAITAHVLRSNDVLKNCTDSSTGLRVLLTHIADEKSYLIAPDYADTISPYLLKQDIDSTQQAHADMYSPQKWGSSGSPVLLFVTKDGLLYNYLHNITLSMWRHILGIASSTRSLFLDPSLSKSAFQLYPYIFQASNFTSAGATSIFGDPGHDIVIAIRFKNEVLRDSSHFPTIVPHLIEGIFTKAFVQYTQKVASVICVTHWGVHTTIRYQNNIHVVPIDMLQQCYNYDSAMDKDLTLPAPLYEESQPHILVLLKLAPSALNQLGAGIHRGPSVVSQKDDAELYSQLFSFSVKGEKMLDKRRFADGDVSVCTKWTRGVSVEEQLHVMLKAFIKHNLSEIVSKAYVRDSLGLLAVVYPDIPPAALISEAQVLITACEHIQSALQAASADCADLPVNIISISMNDEYGRLSAVDSPAYILYLKDEATEEQIPFNNRCITGMITLQNRDAWPKDPGAIACLKLLVMNMLMTHIQTRRPSLHSSAVLKAADVGFKTHMESYLVDNVGYTSYIPSDSKIYLRGSCIDIFMPIRHIDKHVYGKELPDFVPNSEAGGYRGVAFRFFIALPQDQSYYAGSTLRIYRLKDQYYNTIYNILPAHAASVRALSQQFTAYYFTVLLAKRWVTAHLIPMYTLTHIFIDAAANPVTSRVVSNLYQRYKDKEITQNELFELIGADDQEIQDSEDEDAPPQIVKSVFTRAREEASVGHEMTPPSARAYMGYISQEAIELMVAYVFTQHVRDGKSVIASPLVGFRLFLIFLIECFQGMSPMEREYDVFAFMRQWFYEGVNDPEYSMYNLAKRAGDLAESYSNFVMDIYRETVLNRRDQRSYHSYKHGRDNEYSARKKRENYRQKHVAVTDVVVDASAALGQVPLDNKDYELLYNTGNRIIAKNTKLYSSTKDANILYSSGTGKLSADAMLAASIPPVLLRTTYDPSGTLFTASIDTQLLHRLGTYALVSLRALDTYLVAEHPTIHLQALFSTSIDHISAIMEMDDVVHATIRCDGRDMEFAPAPSTVLASKKPQPRQWASCTADTGFGCESMLLFDSVRTSLATAPPIGYDPVSLCLPIISRTLGSYARVQYDSYAGTKVGIQLQSAVAQQCAIQRNSISQEQLLHRVPDRDGNYVFSKELFVESSLAESGRMFKLIVLTADIVPEIADEKGVLDARRQNREQERRQKKVKC